MNIIRMTGGLGNQMFQYALYLKFKSMGIDCVFDDFTEYDPSKPNRRPIQLDVFGIDYPRASKEQYYDFKDSYPGLIAKVKRKLKGRQNREYIEKQFSFDNDILLKDNAYLNGYFQSEKYFKDIEETVLKAFKFTDKVALEAKEVLLENNIDEASFDSENTVSIHIRRGDYLNVSDLYGNICTEEYYDKCVRYICEKVDNPVFYIFTNDIPYARKWAEKYNADGIKMSVIDGNDENKGYVDMYLMSQCKHRIIANSSFSWWGAYLNRKADSLVLAPSKWVNNYDSSDIFADFMTRM